MITAIIFDPTIPIDPMTDLMSRVNTDLARIAEAKKRFEDVSEILKGGFMGSSTTSVEVVDSELNSLGITAEIINKAVSAMINATASIPRQFPVFHYLDFHQKLGHKIHWGKRDLGNTVEVVPFCVNCNRQLRSY